MTTEDDILKQKYVPYLQKLQDNYLKLSRQEKYQRIRIFLDTIKNNNQIKDILIKIRKSNLNEEFGSNILIDTAYMMFPDICAA